ncbi:MAG: EamA family transporter [Ottowia sp.]|nr:EamA family transporter [Ottowia sp.]
MNKEYRGMAAVLLASALWGTTGTAAALAPAVPASAIAAVAMGGGGALQALLAARAIGVQRHLLRRHWALWLLGALAVMAYPLAFYGSMRRAGVTVGTVLTIGAAPLFSAALEVLFEKKTLGLRWLLGCLLGIVGVGLLSAARSAAPGGDAATAGIVMGLLAAFLYAFYSWVARQLMLCGMSARAAMGAVFGAGAVLLLPVLLATGAPLLHSWGNFAVGVYMALFPMFIGYLLFGYGLARVAASSAITLSLFEPVCAAALAAAVLGERLTLLGWTGIALVMACLACIVWPEKRTA